MVWHRSVSRVLLPLILGLAVATSIASAAGLQLSVTDSDWTAVGMTANERFGQFLNPAGDVNGDGYDDFIVSSQHANDPPGSAPAAGAAWLFYGGPTGPAATPDVTFNPPGGLISSHFFGMHASTAGDVNNDGYDDIMIGCTGCDATGGSSDEGMVFVYHGADGGIDTNYDWRARGIALYAHAGWAAAPAGDVNGDNYDDILVGAYRYDADTIHHAYLFFGSSTGLNAEGARSEGTPSNCDWWAEGEQTYDGFGLILGSAGDLNNDGYGDFFVGASTWDNGGQTDAGKIWVWYGSDSGPTAPGNTATADWSTEGTVKNDRLGGGGGDYDPGTAGVGDVNGDGYDDLLVGCFGCDVGAIDNGSISLWYGSASGLNSGPANWAVAGLHDGNVLGFVVTSAGDFNGDGYGDFMMSEHGWDQTWDPNNHTNEGRVGLWLGSPVGPTAEPFPIYADCLMAGDQTGARYSLALAGGVDVDDDGFDEIVISADSYDSLGKIFLFSGQALVIADDFESKDTGRWTLVWP